MNPQSLLLSTVEPHTLKVGGVNHCSFHCRMAKFRCLMHTGRYGAVINFEKPIAWKLLLGTHKQRVSRPITASYFPLYIKPRNVVKRQCKLQWLTPPIKL
jgi:hypothetical protein